MFRFLFVCIPRPYQCKREKNCRPATLLYYFRAQRRFMAEWGKQVTVVANVNTKKQVDPELLATLMP